MNDKHVTWVRIEPDASQAEPTPEFKPLIPRKIKIAGIVLGVLGGLAYMAHTDYKLEREIYQENLASAKALLNAEDNIDSRREEDRLWSYIGTIRREQDLRNVSHSETQTIANLLNNNKVQGARRGEPLN